MDGCTAIREPLLPSLARSHRSTLTRSLWLSVVIRIERCMVNSMPFDYVLISRRGCLRTGARYHTRGADPLGHVANFVETEQMIIFNGNVSAWVETRGSIPVLWEQKGRSLKPKPVVLPSPHTVRR